MQMVEYGKERVLSFLCSVEELHIVQYQHINHLVKMNEIIDGIIPAVVLKLIDELL
jgi:hypothetical protein